MRIGTKEIGRYGSCFVVAEIGINHNGSVAIAKQLIDVAKTAGCDAVKFQKRTIDVVYTPEELARPRENPFGLTNGDLKRGLEFSELQYSEIDEYCAKRNILWFASPWDLASVEFLEKFDPPAYKVASACVTDWPLLYRLNRIRRPIIMSTGMSTHKQVQDAVERLNECDVVLLACTATYPASLGDLHLARMMRLSMDFGVPMGWSGHEVSPWPTLCAVAIGASIVERHITLDRTMWGSDQAASLEPDALIKLVREIRDFDKALGIGDLRILDCEREVLKKLRRVECGQSE